MNSKLHVLVSKNYSFSGYSDLQSVNYQFPCFAICLSCHFGIDNLVRRRLRRRGLMHEAFSFDFTHSMQQAFLVKTL